MPNLSFILSLLLPLIFILSFLCTWCLRQYALARNILDIPNHRSSHLAPTPRGGGLSFVIVFLCVVFFLGTRFGFITSAGLGALFVAGLFVAALGWLDDHGHIRVTWRLLGHFVASVLAVYWEGGMPSMIICGFTLSQPFLLNALAVMYLVWLLNLYNFMDGIDGLAAIEALCVCLGMASIYFMCGDAPLMVLPLVLSSAVAGFLCWNFPRARIFMGDAGSGFLGFILGVLSIQALVIHAHYFWCWLILLGGFIVDATYTLFARLLRGDTFYEAHRSHAYQHAVDLFQTHSKVTLSMLVLNLVWLWPWAILVGLGYIDGCVGLISAYCPVILLAMQLKAGHHEEIP